MEVKVVVNVVEVIYSEVKKIPWIIKNLKNGLHIDYKIKIYLKINWNNQ